MKEPIAIVGLAGIYPGAPDLDAFWSNLESGTCSLGVSRPARWSPESYVDTSPAAGDRAVTALGGWLPDVAVDLARFGIPPAQAASMARAQSLFLEVVDRCLADAGLAHRGFDRDRTDVVAATCFGSDRTYANALRVESARFALRFAEALRDATPGMDDAEVRRVASELKARFQSRFGGAAHDRPGEMASTIPARISIAHRLRGRCVAVESSDATSFAALQIAVDTLRAREAEVVIVAAGQLLDGPLHHVAFSRKGWLAAEAPVPFERGAAGFVIAEGVGAMALERLSDAEAHGDRVYAVIDAVALAHGSTAGSFGYSGSTFDAKAAMIAAQREAAWDPLTIQYVECAAVTLPGHVERELTHLAAALGSGGTSRGDVLIGSVRENIGHGMASAGLAAVTKVALALHHRRLVPQAALRDDLALDLSELPFAVNRKSRPWPENAGGAPRRAAVNGLGFTGTHAHVLLEEHVPRRPYASTAAPARPPIAVVGGGARFRHAASAGDYWNNILARRDTLEPLPESVVERAVYFNPENLDPFTTYTVLGSRVEDPSEDLGLPAERAERMDRAQKLTLAAAKEALGGLRLPDRRAAVVLGSSLALDAERAANLRVQYHLLEEVLAELPAFAALGRTAKARILDQLRERIRDVVAPLSAATLDGYLSSGIGAVISNELGLNAVPLSVEAACASSMAALDVALRGLAARRWDFAVAGGVELAVTARDLVVCSSLRLLSPERIAPFDERADGFSAGEGVALFALERLDDAIALGHPIRAVIRGLGASCDARSLIAPDAEGQSLAIRRAFEGVEFGPESVQFLEAHGTGTTVGDQVEARAISSVYRGRETPLAIGSVKSMIGHTFAAAGAAGLLKTICALENKTIPPNLPLRRLNPRLELEAVPAYVSVEATPWPAPRGAPRRAAVSAMGTGGINFHLLLEEAS